MKKIEKQCTPGRIIPARLLNVFPCSFSYHIEHSGESNAEHFAKPFAGVFIPIIQASDFTNLCLGDFGSMNVFTTSNSSPLLAPEAFESLALRFKPALGASVMGIGASCSKKEMVRSYARSNIAMVKHALFIRDCTKMEFPRYSVRANWFSRTFMNLPVPFGFRSSPNPAFSKVRHVFRDRSIFIDIRPKRIWTETAGWFRRLIRHNVSLSVPTLCLAVGARRQPALTAILNALQITVNGVFRVRLCPTMHGTAHSG